MFDKTNTWEIFNFCYHFNLWIILSSLVIKSPKHLVQTFLMAIKNKEGEINILWLFWEVP